MRYERKLKILRKLYGKYFWSMTDWENKTEFKKRLNNAKRDILMILILWVSDGDDDILKEVLTSLTYGDVNQVE